ncbi:MAG TPA: ABC transporter substrate-binding protein [Geopsychrobacteraceae bacterium]|nr:ABC transporter substrate-binding protein [Geopsychrobacteraceae bacterium]
MPTLQHFTVHCGVKTIATLISLCLILGLLACTEKEPVKIGLIAGLSGRVADLGIAARNGAILAVEEQNQAGGVQGAKVELLVRDDKNDEDQVRKSVNELIDQGIEALIGPMTSQMVMAALPLANQHQLMMIGPTATSEELTGIDDYFYRIVASTSNNSTHHANHLQIEMGLSHLSIISDTSNAAFVDSYLHDFKTNFEKRGGHIDRNETFRTGAKHSLYDVAQRAIHSETDAVLIIANAMDTAILCQQIKKINPDITIATSEWSATEKLIELGGRAVEGILFHQFFNRESSEPSYLAFRDTYLKRFGNEPGFAAVVGYDSTKVALVALDSREEKTLKESLARLSSFPGVQGPITFDRFGDTDRETYLSTIKNGKFVILEHAHSY